MNAGVYSCNNSNMVLSFMPNVLQVRNQCSLRSDAAERSV